MAPPVVRAAAIALCVFGGLLVVGTVVTHAYYERVLDDAFGQPAS